MELLLSTRNLIAIPAFNHPNYEFPVIPFHSTRFGPCRFLASSKKSSNFQDFQDLTKPKRLLPTKQLVQGPPDNLISSLKSHESNSLYKVRLCTSSIYGSDLSDQNAGVLVCIIDEHADSMLERIPAFLSQDHFQSLQSEDAITSNVVRFQRGSIDDFVFWGPKLGRIQALWIGLDSGSWRIGGASLTIFSLDDHPRNEGSEIGSMCCMITYDFKTEDVLLGEGSDLAMTELRPCLVTQNFGVDSASIFDGSAQVKSLEEKGITNEDSMREYADLKNSLLLYDSVLIFAGTCITSITASNNTALAFLTGGVAGFLYLLLLQRSVDTLPAPETLASVKEEGNNFNRLFGGVKGPIVVFLLAFSVAVLATRYDKPDIIAALTPQDILAGMVGFLVCKVSVVLAAFKPVSRGMKDDD